MRSFLAKVTILLVILSGCGGGGGGGGGSEPVYDFGLSFFQYRVFENSSTGYQAYVTMTKDGKAIQETDVDDFRIYDSANNLLAPTNSGFNAETYMSLNCMNSPCSQSGPVNENGFYESFAFLPTDTYDVEVDTADGQALTLDVPYPGQLALPIVPSNTMLSSWVGNDLLLNWVNPVTATNWGEVDQLRIRLFDGNGKPVLYIRLDPSAETVTINASLLSQAAGLGNSVLQSWEVQTRAYDANDMNFARAYSNRLALDPQPVTCVGQEINPISLTIGVDLNDSIEPFGTKFYFFEVVEQGSYLISLYNMATDNDWVLYEYISNCEDDYPAEPPVIAESSNLGTTPDIMTVPLEPKTYLLIVDEYDNQPSSYSLGVTKFVAPTDQLPGIPNPISPF